MKEEKIVLWVVTFIYMVSKKIKEKKVMYIKLQWRSSQEVFTC